MENLTIISKADGLELSALYCQAESPKAVLQICHGMTEHKERYIPFMEFLAENGISSFIHDKRGHGQSIKEPGDLGYFYAGDKFACIEDIKSVNECIHEACPGLPVFLFGHSMGSMEVRVYTKKYDNTINGLFVSGCPTPAPLAKPAKLVVKLVTLIKGQRERSPILNNMAIGSYNAPFAHESESEFNWLSIDKDNIVEYESDPLCGFVFTNNGFTVLMDVLLATYSEKGWNCTNPDLPIIFMSGGDDPCMRDRQSFRHAINIMKKGGYKKVDYKIYPGLRHEIINEKSAPYVRDDIVAYLFDHMPDNQAKATDEPVED